MHACLGYPRRLTDTFTTTVVFDVFTLECHKALVKGSFQGNIQKSFVAMRTTKNLDPLSGNVIIIPEKPKKYKNVSILLHCLLLRCVRSYKRDFPQFRMENQKRRNVLQQMNAIMLELKLFSKGFHGDLAQQSVQLKKEDNKIDQFYF